jgi:hypothetical protein
MIITKVQLAAMSRVDIPRHERSDFTLIVDEFQNFATASFASILSEARKFNLSLVITHQYVKQLDEAVSDAVFGNVGTIITFRIGAEDAELLEKEFEPEFTAQDLVNLGFRQIYLKLMIDGVTSHAFSAMTMETIAKPAQSYGPHVIEYSRSMYSRPRLEVEEAIAKWREPIMEERPPRREEMRPQSPRMDGQRPMGPRPPMPQPGNRPLRDQHRRPPRNDRRPQQAPQQPATSLNVLKGGAVDFKGKPVEQKDEGDTGTATLTSAPADDLKTLIARALGKKEEGTS